MFSLGIIVLMLNTILGIQENTLTYCITCSHVLTIAAYLMVRLCHAFLSSG